MRESRQGENEGGVVEVEIFVVAEVEMRTR